MPIYRCNKCGFVSEDTQTPVNTPTACGRCGTPSTVYGTVFFVEELIKRLAFLQGLIDDPTAKKTEKTAEEELAESIRRLAEAAKSNAH